MRRISRVPILLPARIPRGMLLALAVLTAAAAPARAQCLSSFAPVVTYAAGNTPVSVAVGDFNADGRPDLAVVNNNDGNGSLSILLGNADGTFQAPVNYPVGVAPNFVAVADLNGDGILDLAVANRGNANRDQASTISVLMGTSAGTFQSAGTYPASEAYSVAVADFNADGRPDLATAGGGGIGIYLANAPPNAGTFHAPVYYAAGSTPLSLAVGDFNADGRPDLAVANRADDNVSFLRGNANGTFEPPVNYGVGYSPISVTVGDFNADGLPDLAVANQGGGTGGPGTWNSVSILLGNAPPTAATFQAAVNYPVGTGPNSVKVGEFNADGRPDLVTANASSTVSIVLGNGNGTFEPAVNRAAGSGPQSVAVGDFNGDGRPDLVTASTGSINVPVLLNTTPRPVVYVKHTAAGANNGGSWTDAFTQLRDALAYAATEPCIQEIWVAAGTYKPAPPAGSRSASFNLRSNLALYGSFAGTETALSQRNIAANPTILSGDLNGDDNGDLNRNDNSYHVLIAPNANPTALLDGFTIQGGRADAAAGGEQLGGGLFLNPGSPTIVGCTFSENEGRRGGAVHLVGPSSPVFRACTFGGNRAILGGDGGAVYVAGGSVRLDGCTLTENMATDGAGNGGAIEIGDGGAVVSTSCDFLRNRAGGFGGAFDTVASGASMTAVNCTFRGNVCGDGGAVGTSRLGANVSFTGCTLAGNLGAGLASSVLLASSNNAMLRLVNCDIVANLAGREAGITAQASLIQVYNCVVWGNRSGNTSIPLQDNQVKDYAGSSVIIERSIIEGWTGSLGGTGNNGLDPLFLRLPSPGLDGVWGTTDDDYGDLRLAAGSPAIDAGDSLALPLDTFDIDGDGNTTENLPLDLAGFPRFVDDPAAANTGPGNAPHVDRGAYESQVNCLTCPGPREWRSPLGGSFLFPSNWSPSVPNSTHDTLYNLAASYSVNFPSGINATKSAVISKGDVAWNLAGSTYSLTSVSSTALVVGQTALSNPSLTVSGGVLRPAGVQIGQAEGASGTLTLAGPSTRMVVTQQDLYVGFLGTGTMNILGGANVTSRFGRVGDQPGSFGTVLVDGPGSKWTIPFSLTLNNAHVTVRNGAVLDSFITFVVQDGILDGDGTIIGDVINFGTVSPGNSPGTLTVNGNYEQRGEIGEFGSTSGKLTMQVAGTNPGQFDRLVVTGQTQLGGGLIIQGATPTSALPIPPEGLSLPLIDALGGIGTDSTTGQLRNRFDVAFFPRVPGANNGPSDKFLRLAQAEGGGARFFNLVDGTLGAPINVNDPTNTGAAGTPSAVAAGDLDGDGLDDLAITTASSNIVTVLMNRGTIAGEWQGFEGAVQFNTGSNPQGLAIGDIDGDGMKDLAIANQGGNSVSLLKNTTVPMSHAAAFTGQGSLATGTGPVGIVVENFDGSGTRPVIVTADELGGGLSIFIRSSGPGFGFPPRVPKQLPVNFPPAQPACIDIDGDMQRPDLAVRSRSGNAVLILQNLSSGTGNVNFADAIVLPVGNSPESMQVAKLANGKSSLVTANSGDSTISVLVNTAGPGNPLRFAPAVDLPAGTMPLSIASLDVDGDTDGDLAVLTNTGTGNNPIRVRLLRNDFIVGAAQGNDQPTFVIDRDLPDEGAPTDALFVISANLVSPNTTDLLTINRQGGGRGPGGGNLMGNIRPRLNTTQGGVNTCPQDFNGDGIIDPDDLADYISVFFRQPPGPGSDYNGDGNTDPDDLADFIGAYFGLGC